MGRAYTVLMFLTVVWLEDYAFKWQCNDLKNYEYNDEPIGLSLKRYDHSIWECLAILARCYFPKHDLSSVDKVYSDYKNHLIL